MCSNVSLSVPQNVHLSELTIFILCNKELVAKHATIDLVDILFGSKKFKKQFNLIVLICKRYIYKCRMEGKIPYINPFIRSLNFQYEVEKSIAYRNGKSERFHLDWQDIEHIIEQNNL